MVGRKTEPLIIDRELEKLSAQRLRGTAGPKDPSKVEELQARRRSKLVPSHDDVLKAGFRNRFKVPA